MDIQTNENKPHYDLCKCSPEPGENSSRSKPLKVNHIQSKQPFSPSSVPYFPFSLSLFSFHLAASYIFCSSGICHMLSELQHPLRCLWLIFTLYPSSLLTSHFLLDKSCPKRSLCFPLLSQLLVLHSVSPPPLSRLSLWAGKVRGRSTAQWRGQGTRIPR